MLTKSPGSEIMFDKNNELRNLSPKYQTELKLFKRSRTDASLINELSKIDLFPKILEIQSIQIPRRPAYIFLPTREKISSIILQLIDKKATNPK